MSECLECQRYKNIIQDYESCREMGEKLNNKLQTENKALKDNDELRASILVKFQDENKALKEQVFRLRKRIGKDYKNENKRLEESVDNLLKTLKIAKTLSEHDGLPGQSFMRTAIQKAEALKEETNHKKEDI